MLLQCMQQNFCTSFLVYSIEINFLLFYLSLLLIVCCCIFKSLAFGTFFFSLSPSYVVSNKN